MNREKIQQWIEMKYMIGACTFPPEPECMIEPALLAVQAMQADEPDTRIELPSELFKVMPDGYIATTSAEGLYDSMGLHRWQGGPIIYFNDEEE